MKYVQQNFVESFIFRYKSENLFKALQTFSNLTTGWCEAKLFHTSTGLTDIKTAQRAAMKKAITILTESRRKTMSVWKIDRCEDVNGVRWNNVKDKDFGFSASRETKQV